MSLILFWLIYSAIGVLVWIVCGSWALYSYRKSFTKTDYNGNRCSTWSESDEVGTVFAVIFSGPLWPLAFIIGIICVIVAVLENRPKEKVKNACADA